MELNLHAIRLANKPKQGAVREENVLRFASLDTCRLICKARSWE